MLRGRRPAVRGGTGPRACLYAYAETPGPGPSSDRVRCRHCGEDRPRSSVLIQRPRRSREWRPLVSNGLQCMGYQSISYRSKALLLIGAETDGMGARQTVLADAATGVGVASAGQDASDGPTAVFGPPWSGKRRWKRPFANVHSMRDNCFYRASFNPWNQLFRSSSWPPTPA